MSVVHIVPSIANEASGPSYSVRRLCENLAELNVDPVLLTLSPPPLTPPDFLKTFPVALGPHRLGWSPRMNDWLRSEARSGRIQLIHNHGLWGMPNVYAGEAAKRFDLPLVVAPRGTLTRYAFASGSPVKRLFWPLLQKPALAATTCFHATGEAEYLDVRRMGYDQPVAVIPNGIDIPPYDRPAPGELRTLLYLGRLHPEKGLEMLLQAWRRVCGSFPEWDLRIVGPDRQNHLARLRELAAELRLERVAFDGPAYGRDKLTAYRAADLYVLPSPSENFGVSVAEALAAGTPAITTTGAPWAGLQREGAGWWTDISAEALAATLDEALSCSPESLTEMGKKGRDWMQRGFSWPKLADDTLQLYDWLQGKDERPSFVRTS